MQYGMKWPTIAPWSDRRIGGFEIKFRINIFSRWFWKPFYGNSGGMICFHWLCFWSWWQWTAEEIVGGEHGNTGA